MSELGHAIASTLAGRVEGKPRLVEHTDVKAMVEQILAEDKKKNQKQRLTWGPSEAVMTTDHTDRIGLFNKRMAYERLCGYIIQNRMVLQSNGTELERLPDGEYDWSKINDDEQVWRDEIKGVPSGPVRTQKSRRWLVKNAYIRHCATAIGKDPLVCPITADYRAKDERDKIQHMHRAHPAEFADYLGLESEPTAPGKVELPAPPETLPQSFDVTGTPDLVCCGEDHKTQYKLDLHKKSKTHKPATG